ncbi:MAG: peptidylprolyl isomerase [Candidatus Woesearchaeota archaeon]|jgi:peptidylprolyl isomerase|nr:peptidylprolyl isomerase [Candidatus Woesearchaeota archaeon]
MENDKTIVVFETTKGNIEIELFLDESPMTAGNFKKLVEEGFYDKTKFHRVIPNFMVQGGDPLSKNNSMTNRWGTGGPGYAIQDEFIEGLSNKRGTLSMANSGPNSGGSQFFINTVNNTNLDWDKAPASSKHPVFGKVTSGMEIVDAISKVRTTGSDRPLEDIEIIKAYIKN